LHRDVSPDNIMITRQGLIKLLGFDSACDATKVPSRHLSVILKPGFCPEEQYRTRGVQGEWTDVYSVAATLYRCITGSTPPPAPDRLIQDVLVSPSTLCPGLPAGLEAALFKGLAVKAENRYQTIDEFQHDVRPALHTLLRWVAGLNKRREGRERGSSSGRGSF
jgi:serine/threonine protein kinase